MKINQFYPSLINLTFRNKKLEETMQQMNKTSSFWQANKDTENKHNMVKIRKYNTKKRIYYCKSAFDFHKRKKIEIKTKKQSEKNIIKDQKENHTPDNDSVSKNIFNDLDKIQQALIRRFKLYNDNNKENNEINELNQDKCENVQDFMSTNSLRGKYNRNQFNNFLSNYDGKHDSVTIKSNNSINFFNRPISKTIYIKRNFSVLPKRLKSTDEIKIKNITRFLSRKKINDIPITFPLYISHNTRYKSMSEKSRVDKILSKLICLKTHIIKDDLNKYDIIKEFLLKNGIRDKKYFSEKNLFNLYHYLLKPFNFPPEFLLVDIIKEGIKYNPLSSLVETTKSDENNIMNYVSKSRNYIEIEKRNKKSKNNIKIMNSINYSAKENKSMTHYQSAKNFMRKGLSTLIKDLESELRQIHYDKLAKLEEYNNSLDQKMEILKITDKNKYIPNLCLISNGFKEKYKENIDKINKNILKKKNKQEKLKEINNRLYYNIIRKHNKVEFDRNDIKRSAKLTEFVVMEKAKKKFLFENAKINFVNILKKIKQDKNNQSG